VILKFGEFDEPSGMYRQRRKSASVKLAGWRWRLAHARSGSPHWAAPVEPTLSRGVQRHSSWAARNPRGANMFWSALIRRV
jgi:hypothetical protein